MQFPLSLAGTPGSAHCGTDLTKRRCWAFARLQAARSGLKGWPARFPRHGDAASNSPNTGSRSFPFLVARVAARPSLRLRSCVARLVNGDTSEWRLEWTANSLGVSSK